MKPNPQLNLGPIRKLILHFDLNKTILLSDLAMQKTKDDVITEILVAHAWGKIDEKNPNNWKLGHNQFTKVPKEPDMISYKAFVDSLFEHKAAANEPDAELRAKYNKEMDSNRRNYYSNFIKQGNPGIKLKPEYDRIMRNLAIPKSVLDELQILHDDLAKKPAKSGSNVYDENLEEVKADDRGHLYDLFSDGKCYIIPAFFRTLLGLKKAKKEFAVVFRTFGTELDKVVFEFNKFCNGEHPMYNGRNNTPLARFDGSKNSKSYVVNSGQQGIIYRMSQGIGNMVMVAGNLRRVERTANFEDAYAKEIEEDSVKILKGGAEIYVKMMEMLKESCALAYQDDWEYWNKNGEKMEFSKPLLIDQSDYSILQIFFDDNITDNEDCIVDVIEVVDGSRIPFKKAMNKYIVKVESLDILKDGDVFIKAIDMCEKARIEEIERIEKGIVEESPDEQKKSEWELLQESPDDEYLRRTVMPLLHPALKIVDIERPNNPISFIALYLLKNKDKVKIPPLPADYFLEKAPEEQQELEETEKQKTEEEKKENTSTGKKQPEKENKNPVKPAIKK